MKRWQRLWRLVRRPAKYGWRVASLALSKYTETDGEQRAASFAYYAFFALFPLILLFVSVASMFVDEVRASNAIIAFVDQFIPAGSGEENIITSTINGVMKSRSGAGIVALLGLAWSSLRFFQALVRGVNRAWGTIEYSWWRIPIKNLSMIGIVASALLLGIIFPIVIDYVEYYYWQYGVTDYGIALLVFTSSRWVFPPLVLFYGFTMFYKFAPRRKTVFGEVWFGALFVTISLLLLRGMFVLYVKNFANFNALYGTFGGVVALLMWIYLSGSIIILGGCICAAQSEESGKGSEAKRKMAAPGGA
jgi:YihY family inner membrane protein